MSSLSLLDIAIAMIFFFLLLSLVCSAANEIFAAVLQTRAQFLKRGIYRLLVTEEFAEAFYEHPLIKGLADEVDWLLKWFHKGHPSYIPSRTFALVLIDLTNRNSPPVPAELQQALTALLNNVDRDPVKIQAGIEAWYNDAMDRVSGGYKRRVQYVLLALGLVAAIAMNADAIAVIERLSTGKTLSSAVAEAAQRYMDHADSRLTLYETVSMLDKLQLPIGWADSTWPADRAAVVRLIATHGGGWLITALAISFGAPFWFDVLNRFMIVRSTVKPQEKSPAEPSKS